MVMNYYELNGLSHERVMSTQVVTGSTRFRSHDWTWKLLWLVISSLSPCSLDCQPLSLRTLAPPLAPWLSDGVFAGQLCCFHSQSFTDVGIPLKRQFRWSKCGSFWSLWATLVIKNLSILRWRIKEKFSLARAIPGGIEKKHGLNGLTGNRADYPL